SVTPQTWPTVAETRPVTWSPSRPHGATSNLASRRGKARKPASFATAARVRSSAARSNRRPVSATSRRATGTFQGRSAVCSDLVIWLIAAKAIENGLSEPADRLRLDIEPMQQQDRMQHDHLETPVNRIRHAEVLIKGSRSRLRHDRAIQGRNDSVPRGTAKQVKYHQDSSAAATIYRNRSEERRVGKECR